MPFMVLPESGKWTRDPGPNIASAITNNPWVSQPSVFQTGGERFLAALSRMLTPAPDIPMAPGRIGVLPGLEKVASKLTREGLRGPWFHGTKTPEGILGLEAFGQSTPARIRAWEEALSQLEPHADATDLAFAREQLGRAKTPLGFSPSLVGSAYGTRLGEPAGVSLTRDLAVARKFGTPLRVGVDIPPSSVGDLLDPEVQRLLREAFTKGSGGITPYQLREAADLGYQPPGFGVDPAQVNQAMSDYLRSKGVEALRFNPRRWNEFELRVLDPKRAIPLGTIENPTEGIPWRYYYGKGSDRPYASWAGEMRGAHRMLQSQLQSAPEFPVRLKEILGVPGTD